MIKRLLQIISITALLWLPVLNVSLTPAASAVNVFGKACNLNTNGGGTPAVCQEANKGGNPVIKAIRVAITILSVVIGSVAVIVIILSGFKMIRANGNAQDIATARTGIIYAVIGLAIAVIAPLIVGFVLNNT